MALIFKCPDCGTIWQVGPNIEKEIRFMRLLSPENIRMFAMTGERKCDGCGRTMTIQEIFADAYDAPQEMTHTQGSTSASGNNASPQGTKQTTVNTSTIHQPDPNTILQRLLEFGDFNVFVGAGISRPAPANAPVWREIQSQFISGIFDKIFEQQWIYTNTLEHDKNILVNYPFRPEQFWEMIQSLSSPELVHKYLQALLDAGEPNHSHKFLAAGLERKTIKNLITTNFDEYIERSISSHIPVITSENDHAEQNGFSDSASKHSLLKLHGTLSKPETMQYTMRHLKKLPDWEADFFRQCLAGKPLLIAGYSGWDEDVLPVLLEIAEKLPLVVLVVYPGSSVDEPVRKIINSSDHVIMIEANIHDLLSDWATELAINVPENIPMNPATAAPKHEWSVPKIFSEQPVPWMPYIISNLFAFGGHTKLAGKYSESAGDAIFDDKYSGSVSQKLHADIIVNDIHILSRDGQTDYALGKYSMDMPDIETIGDRLRIAWAIVVNENSSNHQLEEAEKWALGLYIMGKNHFINQGVLFFQACWCLGRLRTRQGRYIDAMGAYVDAEKLVVPEKITDSIGYISFTSFLLDYGSCLYEYAVSEGNEQIMAKAHALFQLADGIAKQTADHITHAQSRMMLAKVNAMAGKFDEAKQCAQAAIALAEKTGDGNLIGRAAAVNKWLTDFIAAYGP